MEDESRINRLLNAEERKKQMRGFEETERILKLERIERLRNMTQEESMKIYDDLCEFYYLYAVIEGIAAPDIFSANLVRHTTKKHRQVAIRPHPPAPSP